MQGQTGYTQRFSFCSFIIIARFLFVSYDLPALASLVLVLQVHTTKPGLILLLYVKLLTPSPCLTPFHQKIMYVSVVCVCSKPCFENKCTPILK